MPTSSQLSATDSKVFEGTPVGIWIRVSTQDQAEGDSPKHHEHRARAYADIKGWNVVRVYDLCGVSGKTVKDHPECQAMMADIASGRIKGLIFSRLARFGRNTRELLDFMDHFIDHDAHLVSLHEAVDTSTPQGRMFYTVIASFAQMEREVIIERIKASIPTRVKLGKSLGGYAPYGYKWVDKQLEIDETEAPIRRRMYELFKKHKRYRTVARLLTEAGFRTRKGKEFSSTTVKRLVTDPIAKGLRRANYRDNSSGRNGARLKPESEWLYTTAPAIVSDELWEECNALIQEQTVKRKPRARKAVHLFGGLVYCHCGEKMYKPTKLKKYDCRVCHNKISLSDLETIFVEQLKGFFFDEVEIAKHVGQTNSALAEKQALLASANSEIASVEKEMEKVYRAYIDEEINAETFGRLYTPLETRKLALADEVPRIQGQIDAHTVDSYSIDLVVSESQILYEHWDDLFFDEKRGIVETIVDRIVIGDDAVDIELAYVPVKTKGDERTDRNAIPTPHPPSPQTGTKGEHPLKGAVKNPSPQYCGEVTERSEVGGCRLSALFCPQLIHAQF